MRAPIFTAKIPASIQAENRSIQDEFGVPSERQTVAACIAIVAQLMRYGSLQRLVAYQASASVQAETDNGSVGALGY